MTRPIGKIPQWPAGNASAYFVPDTFNPFEANYPFGELAKWFAVHDGIEVANYGASIVLDSGLETWGTPGDTWRRCHLAFDPRMVYYAGVRNSGSNDEASMLWSHDGMSWAEDTSSVQCAGTMTDTWYQVALTDAGDTLTWVTGKNGSVYRQTRAFQRLAAESTLLPTFANGGAEYTAVTAGLVIENVVYDPESTRMFAVGWDYNTGDGAVYFVDPIADVDDSWNTYLWSSDFAPTGIQIRFVAVAPGYKVIASPTHLWWGQGILSTFRHIAVADAMPGETLIKGLIYSETDKVFIAIGVNKIWTSANGVQWSETSAPPSFDFPLLESYTGAVACLGGAVVAVAQVSPNPSAAKSFCLAVGLNALRDWYIVPCPVTNAAVSPAQNIYPLGNRLVALNSRNAASIRHGLGAP